MKNKNPNGQVDAATLAAMRLSGVAGVARQAVLSRDSRAPVAEQQSDVVIAPTRMGGK